MIPPPLCSEILKKAVSHVSSVDTEKKDHLSQTLMCGLSKQLKNKWLRESDK